MRTPHGIPVGEVWERYRIGGQFYEVIAQNDFELAVRIRNETWDGSGEDWIRYPHSRFETTGGAREAILNHLEEREL